MAWLDDADRRLTRERSSVRDAEREMVEDLDFDLFKATSSGISSVGVRILGVSIPGVALFGMSSCTVASSVASSFMGSSAFFSASTSVSGGLGGRSVCSPAAEDFLDFGLPPPAPTSVCSGVIGLGAGIARLSRLTTASLLCALLKDGYGREIRSESMEVAAVDVLAMSEPSKSLVDAARSRVE